MKILAFDTATRATSVALALSDAEPALEARDDPPPGERPRHTTRLLALVASLLEESRTSFGELDRIAVGVGPGTFTGLRVGIATARALAQAREVPLVGVSTLHSLALGAERVLAEHPHRSAVVPLIDARRGEVFVAAWPSGALERAASISPRALKPEALVELLEGEGAIQPATALALGDGALAFRAVVERSGVLIPDDDSELHRVSAANHCRLARSLEPGRRDQVEPCYLRPPDAQPRRGTLAAPR